MGNQLEDIQPHLEKKRQEERLKTVEQIRHQVRVAAVMSELQADPRWELWGNHVEAVKAEYKRQEGGYTQALAGNEFLEPKRYGQLKLSQAEARGVVKGIEIAMNMAKVLIERGEAAIKELELGENK